LREIASAASRVAVILNPSTPHAALANKELEAAVSVAKVELRALEVGSPEVIAPQLTVAKEARAGALAILEDSLTLSHWKEMAMRLPAA
jgi:hypothetical protein